MVDIVSRLFPYTCREYVIISPIYSAIPAQNKKTHVYPVCPLGILRIHESHSLRPARSYDRYVDKSRFLANYSLTEYIQFKVLFTIPSLRTFVNSYWQFPLNVIIIKPIEVFTGYEENKYFYVKHTESCRLMRGAWEAQKEYISELCTEIWVGCNGVAHVIEA